MEFKKLMKYIEENKEEHFDELIKKKNENAIKESDKKKNEKRKQILKKIVTIFTEELLGTYKYRIQGGYL
jgi:hypothetical protein